MPVLHVKRGIEFRPELYKGTDRTAWLDAVGKEIEAKGITIKVGEGAGAKEVKNAAELQAAYKELEKAASRAGTTLKGYIGDLVQALDDVVKSTSQVAAGDMFDFTTASDLSKALGLADGKTTNYASSVTTEFGKQARTRPENTMNAAGSVLQAKEATPVGPVTPPPPVVPTGVVDLAVTPHMSIEKLTGVQTVYSRTGSEYDGTDVITGLSMQDAVKLAGAALSDLQRSKGAAGLSVGSAELDEMDWSSTGHAMRRSTGALSLTLDYRSLELNPRNGQPRVAVGRDFFFDGGYAHVDVVTGKMTTGLQDKAHIMYRDRIRYGGDKDPLTGTRVLIGSKFNTHIENGEKVADKTDNRTDSATDAILKTLSQSAKTGILTSDWGSWQGGQSPPASREVFRAAQQSGLAVDYQGEHGVLVLDKAAVVRQPRGRIHLDESDPSAVIENFNKAGEPILKNLADLIGKAASFPAGNNLPSRDQLLAECNALLDRSAIVEAAKANIAKIDPNLTVDKALIDRLWPGQRPASIADAELQEQIADAIRSTYDTFSDHFDQLKQKIGGNEARSVRDAGSSKDVMDFMRNKSFVARFMQYCEQNTSASGVTVGNPQSYKAYAEKILAMPEGTGDERKAKTDLLQAMGVGTDTLSALTVEQLSSPLKINAELTKKQIVDPFLAEFDAQLAGPNKAQFVTEMAAFLKSKNSGALSTNAASPDATLGDIRKNLVTAEVDIYHRMIEGAGTWAQSIAFNNVREVGLNIRANTGNFIISSLDYSEYFKAADGDALEFKDRVSRGPLDPVKTKMLHAKIGNDAQIELASEQTYKTAQMQAQYGINGAVAGMIMDWAKQNGTPNVHPADPATFDAFLKEQMTGSNKQKFIDSLAKFATRAGSPIDVTKALDSLVEQNAQITILTEFAKSKNPQLDTKDRAAVETWYRTQANGQSADVEKFLDELAAFAGKAGSSVRISASLIRSLDFKPFIAAHAGQPVDGQKDLVAKQRLADRVWEKVLAGKAEYRAARGREVLKIAEDNGFSNVKWEPPKEAKVDEAIRLAVA